MTTLTVFQRLLFGSLAGVLLVGCSGISPNSRLSETGIAVPGTWGSTKEATAGVNGDWIRRFGDSRLVDLVTEAEKANPDVKAAAARMRAAENVAISAGADRRPQANLVFDGSRSKRNFIGFPIFGGDPAAGGGGGGVQAARVNTFGLSLDVNWEIDLWGRVRAGESAAIADADAAMADWQAARVSLAAQVAKAYFTVIESNEQVNASEEALRILKETEDVVRQRFESGQGDAGSIGSQLRVARSDVEAAKADLAESSQRRESAARQLEILLGRYPNVNYDASRSLPVLNATPPAGIPSGMLLRRPDVIAAERRFASRGKAVKEAKLAIFPQLRLTGNGGSSTDDLNQILNSDFGVWNIAAGVVQPILAGGQIRSTYRQRQANEDEALASLQKTVLNAFLEVESALANEQWLLTRERALKKSLDLAVEADDEARNSFKDGVGTIISVFETQRRVILARRNLLAVRYARLENRINLHLALGGDFLK